MQMQKNATVTTNIHFFLPQPAFLRLDLCGPLVLLSDGIQGILHSDWHAPPPTLPKPPCIAAGAGRQGTCKESVQLEHTLMSELYLQKIVINTIQAPVPSGSKIPKAALCS